MKKTKLFYLLYIVSLLGTSDIMAVTITSFGDTDIPTFTVDEFTSFTSYTQNSASIEIFGVDSGQTLSGFFSTIDLQSVWGEDLRLEGTTTIAPESSFNITLFDLSDRRAEFVNGTWTGSNGILNQGFTLLSLDSEDSGFDNTQIYAVELITGGVGSSIEANLTGLSMYAVPEPSTYALFAGLLTLGFIAIRRSRFWA